MSSRVLVYGGKGALGSALVSHFKVKGWWVCSVDLGENEEANENVTVDPSSTWSEQEVFVLGAIQNLLEDGGKLDSILNVAGGWAGGSASSKDMVKNADLMWKQSVWSSTIAARLATTHLKVGGCLVLPGAFPALKGTPGMMGYGMAKAAVHQLAKSLAEPKSGLPQDALTVAILPVTLDTPMNRKWMPKADTSTWTPLQFVADLLFEWSVDEGRPLSGSLVKLITEDGKTRAVCE